MMNKTIGLTTMPHHPLEQMLIRFGLQVIDEYQQAGVLHLHVGSPGSHALLPAASGCSAWVLVGATVQDEPVLDPKLLNILVCPVSKAPLIYNEETQELMCKASGLAYPVRDGIPVMLEEEARAMTADEKLD